MKRNEKGFTLVELLAVIVILGLLMAIAIPSVTKYITQSRKKTLLSTMDSYVTAVTTAVNDNEFGALSNQDIMYYIPVSDDENNSCVSLEKGGTDPFGNWVEAYVAVNYDASKYSYDYYFTFYDDAGYGMELTSIDNLKESGNLITNPSPVNASNITTQTNGRATKTMVLTSGSCDVKAAVPGGTVVNNQGGGAGNNNNNNNNNGGNNVVDPNNKITFTIRGSINGNVTTNTYQADYGMTWAEWSASSYNTAGVQVHSGDGNVANAMWTFTYLNDGRDVLYSHVIEDGMVVGWTYTSVPGVPDPF